MRAIRLAAAAATIAAASPAMAQTVDLSAIQCREFVGFSKERIAILVTWLEGYYVEEGENPVLDLAKFSKDAEQLRTYCTENPATTVMTAAQNVFSKDED